MRAIQLTIHNEHQALLGPLNLKVHVLKHKGQCGFFLLASAD